MRGMFQDPELRIFAERLHRLRESRNKTRRQLADLCGLAPNAIYKYERQKAWPSLPSLIALATYFGVTVDFLIGGGDAAPVRHARWDENGRCTNCGCHAPYCGTIWEWYKSRYCCECGSIMDNGEKRTKDEPG